MEERLLNDYIRISDPNLMNTKRVDSFDSLDDYQLNAANCDCLNFWGYFNEDDEEPVKTPTQNLSEKYDERYQSIYTNKRVLYLREQQGYEKQHTNQEEREDIVDSNNEQINQDTIFRRVPGIVREEVGEARSSTKLSFTSSSFSEGDEIETEQQHQYQQHKQSPQNISLIDTSISDGSSSTLSFDPKEFDEKEFESDFGMEDSGRSSVVFDVAIKLPTIQENLVEKSFSCDVGDNLNQILFLF